MTLACNFLFLCVRSLLSFGIREIVALYNELESIPSSIIFWNSLRRIGFNSFLDV